MILLLKGLTCLCDLIFNLLHQIEKLIKVDSAVGVGVDVLDEISHFFRVSLEAAHDGLEVLYIYEACLVFIEKIEYLS